MTIQTSTGESVWVPKGKPLRLSTGSQESAPAPTALSAEAKRRYTFCNALRVWLQAINGDAPAMTEETPFAFLNETLPAFYDLHRQIVRVCGKGASLRGYAANAGISALELAARVCMGKEKTGRPTTFHPHYKVKEAADYLDWLERHDCEEVVGGEY